MSGRALLLWTACLTHAHLLLALEKHLAKERKQKVRDLSHVLGSLEEHKNLGVSFEDILSSLQG